MMILSNFGVKQVPLNTAIACCSYRKVVTLSICIFTAFCVLICFCFNSVLGRQLLCEKYEN